MCNVVDSLPRMIAGWRPVLARLLFIWWLKSNGDFMVALQGTHMNAVPMRDAIQMKFVDPAGDVMQMARDLGIVFG